MSEVMNYWVIYVFWRKPIKIYINVVTLDVNIKGRSLSFKLLIGGMGARGGGRGSITQR